MPITENGHPVPGKWWCRFSHGVVGTTHFITEEEPVLTFYENGTASLEADENFVVFPSTGFQVYWKVYHPAQGETYERTRPEELRRLDAIEAGGNPVQADSGERTPDPGEAE